MSVLDDWTAAACTTLGLDQAAAAAARDRVLELARDVAHGVVRPAAPLAAYLLGVAVGRGADPAEAAAALSALARNWPAVGPEERAP